MRKAFRYLGLILAVLRGAAAPLSAFVLVSCAAMSSVARDDMAADAQAIVSHTVKVSVAMLVDVSSLTHEPFPVVIGWSGSGSIVAVDGRDQESLVLTAKHVCSVPRTVDTQFGTFPVVASVTTIQTHDGRYFLGRSMHESPYSDSCVVVMYGVGPSSTPAKLADEPPPVGAVVQSAGAPLGAMEPDMVPVVDGRFSGTIAFMSGLGDMRMSVVTIPVAPGQSGSGVYYRGRLFGVVSMRTLEFEHLCLVVHFTSVRSTVDYAVSVWRAGR